MAKREKAFTLLEVMLIIVILGIVTQIIFYNFTQYLTYSRLEMSTNVVISYLRKTKQLAITKQNNFSIELFNKSVLKIYDEYNNLYIEEVTIDDRIIIIHTRASNKTVFNPLGTTNMAGSFILSNGKGEKKQVIIGSTGRIRVKSL